MTVLAVPDTCAICNGRGRVSEASACPACGGTGVSTAEEAAKYRAVLTAAALEGAKQRYAAAGVQAAEGWLREVEQARAAAAETRARAGQVLDALNRAQLVHLAVRATLADTQAMHAQTRAIVEQAQAFAPRSLPVTPPGMPVQPIPGATRDPVYLIDSIYVRELDVWGVLNIPGGSGGLLTNPMTTLGDLITGGASGTPLRLGVGANTQVLTVSGGVPTWQNSAAGFANPMTTVADMIVALAGGTATRLPYSGVAGNVLTGISSTTIGWAAPAFVNPMAAKGDIIYNNALFNPAALPIGATGQVLGVSAGLPAWVTNPAGFANPMTTSGDLITATAGGTAIRLGVGPNGQVLTVSGGVPSWQTPGGPVAFLFPSNDLSGTTDDAAFAAAVASLPNGGLIQLAPGSFYTKAGWVPPAQTTASPYGSAFAGNPVSIRGCGAATTLFPVGAAITGIFYHRATSYDGQYGLAAQPETGFLRDFVIDGTRATGASIGVDWGDGWGYEFDLVVQNFATAGAIGVLQTNRHFWTEKNDRVRFRLSNNTTAMYITTALAPSGDHSSEYNMYDISMFCQANQQGIVVDGVNMGGSHLWLRGNMSSLGSSPPANLAALSIINAAGVTALDGKRWYEGSIWIKVEANPGNGLGAGNPLLMFSDGAGYVRLCSGAIYDSQLAPGVWNGAEFSFNGPIGDTALAVAWPSTTFPGLGNPWNNKGPNALVSVAGGTVTGVSVNGQATGLTQGLFPVQAGGSLTVSGSVAPTTFNVLPAALPNGYSGF